MAAMKATISLLLALVATVSTGPINWPQGEDNLAVSTGRQQCATYCTGSSKFRYEVGKVYRYQYETTTQTSFHGVSDDVAKVRVTAIVSIGVFSKCQLSLSLSDVTITSSESSGKNGMQSIEDKLFKSALERNTLQFSFQDGRIEDVCPSDEEDVQSLNFKRGILSAFQNSLSQHERDESLKEIDVTGVCPTDYKLVQKGWKSLQFSKTKDLLGCTDRHHYRTTLQSTPFQLPDAIQSLPLLKGSHRCTQTLSVDGYLQTSSCSELLVFRPFSKQEAGARTEVNQNLSYLDVSSAQLNNQEPTRRSSLLFEHQLTSGSNEQKLWSARQKLTELCRITAQEVTAEVPGLFADLVYLMRGLETQDLLEISMQVERGTICEKKNKALKFYQDALAMVGSASSIEVMTNMLLSQTITGTQADVSITSLHFVQTPTLNMMSHLKKLLLSESLRQSALLPVTTLVNKFCRSQSNCETIPEVRDIVLVLNSILGRDCGASDDQNLILMTLRAVGNLGYSDALSVTLSRCVGSSSTPDSIKVAAIQAYRGLTCSADRGILMDTFLNTQEDSELRIAAYLGVMQCWDESSLKQVKTMLEKEEVNQVGSFVWTHLTNLMETTSLHKQALREILADDKLQKDFNMDRRKYSRNYELSFFSEKFGAGMMGESNLIWSSNSFVPRSLMVNLTVDMLGHSVNLFELGGRVQGLEAFIKNYLGANGVFKGGEAPKERAPSRCVKQEKMDSMKKKFAVDEDELTASLYLRMFGNDFGFSQFSQKDLKSLKDRFNLKNIESALASGKDISFSQSAMFLDSSIIVPTVAGVALTLSVNGTASMDLVANGKVDMRKLSMKQFEAKFEIKPSAAIQLSGVMSVNVGSTLAGLKMVTTLHTSTSASGRLDLTSGQVLKLDLDTPTQNMDIINAKSEFFLIHKKAEVKQEITRQEKSTQVSCSPESVLRVLGYELCGSVSFFNMSNDQSAPYFPLTGPVTLGVTLTKKDAPKGFTLLGKYNKNKATSIASLSFDTPSSMVDRAITIGYYLDSTVKSVEVEMMSPWKKITAKGTYTDDPNNRKLTGIVVDDGHEYTLEAKLDQNKYKDKTIYTPSLSIQRPPSSSKSLAKIPQKLIVTGSVTVYNDLSEIQAAANIKPAMYPDPIEVKMGYVNKENLNTVSGSITLANVDTYSATFQVAKSMLKGKSWSGKFEPTLLISVPSRRLLLLSGQFEFREDKMWKANMSVIMDKTLSQPIGVEGKITKTFKKGSPQIAVESSLSSEFASIKTKGNIDYVTENKKGAIFNMKMDVDYNLPVVMDRNLRKNKVALSFAVLNKSTKSSPTKLEINIGMDSKIYQDASFVSQFELTRNDSAAKATFTVKTGAKAKLVSDKLHDLKLEFTMNHKLDNNTVDIGYGLQVLYPGKNIEYEIKGKHEHQLQNNFFFETYVAFIFAKGKSVEFRLMGKNNTKSSTLDASGLLEINFPSFEIEGRKYASRTYKLGTTITQNAVQEYIHTVNLQIDNDQKHTLVTKFNLGSDNRLDFYSQLQLAMEPPVKLTLSASRESKNMKGLVEFVRDGEIYSGTVSFNVQGEKYQMNAYSWDFICPDRRVRGFLEAGQKQQNGADLKFEVAWDADRDATQAVFCETSYGHESNKKTQKADMSLVVKTPFENHRIYTYQRQILVTVKEIKEEFKIIWQKKENELSYMLWMMIPPSLERIEMKTKIVTPLDSLRNFGLEVMHKFDGWRHLSTSLKGAYNDDEMMVALIIANTGDKIRNVLEGSFTITSTLQEYRNVMLKLKHNDDGRTYSTELSYQKNADQYKATFDTTYFRIQYNVQLDSKLHLVIPSQKPITLSWLHSNTLTDLNSTLALSWTPEYDSRLSVVLKVNNVEKDYAVDIAFSGPLPTVKNFELQYRHNMLIETSGSFFARVNKDPQMTSRASYKYSNLDIISEFTFPNGQGKLRANLKNLPYTLLLEMTLQGEGENRWVDKKIIVDASIDKSYTGEWTADAKLTTPWEEAQSVSIRGSLQKTSQAVWKLETAVGLGIRQQITVDLSLDPENLTQLSGQITTPYKEVQSISCGYLRKEVGKVYDLDMFMEVLPYFNKVQLQQTVSLEPGISVRYYLGLPDLFLKFLEIRLNHTEQRRGYTSQLKVNYHPDQEILLNVTSRFNKNKFPDNTKVSIDFSSPFEEILDFSALSEINKESGKWTGLLDLKTSSEDFAYFTIKLGQASSEMSSYTDLEVESSLMETISTGVHLDWGDLAAANLTLRAPSIGRSMVGFKKYSKSWTDFQNRVFFELDGKDLDIDVGLKHDENITKVKLLWSYYGSEHSYLDTSIYRIGNSPRDFDVGGFLQVGRNSKPYNISMQYAMVDTKTAFGTTLETPFTNALSYLVKNEKQEDGKHVTVLYGKYGTGYLFDSFTSYAVLENSVDITTRNEYFLDGQGNKFGTTVTVSWSQDVQTAWVTPYFGDKWVKTEFIHKMGDSSQPEAVDLMIFTPFEGFTDIGLRFKLNKQKKDHVFGSCTIEYMDENEAVLTFDIQQPRDNMTTLKATLNLPLNEYMTNTMTYQHSRSNNLLTATAEIITGKGERVTGNFEMKRNEDYTLTLTGPLEQFTSLKVAGKYNENDQRVRGSAQLLLASNAEPLTLEYNMQSSTLPISMDFKLRTPFTNFRTADLIVSHDNFDWKQFRNTAVLTSENIGDVKVSTTWRFSSVKDLELSTLLTSSIQNAENLKLVFSTKESSGSQLCNLKVGWQADKELSLNNSWSLSTVNDKTKFSTNIGLSTPFQEVKTVNVKLSHSHSEDKFVEGVLLAHNGQTYLDADLSYLYGGKNQGVVEIRSPRPMALVVTGSTNSQLLEGTVNFKWDKRSPEGQIEIVTMLADRSDSLKIDREFKLKAIHPVRIMALQGSYKKANNEIISSGLLTWDEQNSNTFSYDMSWTNRTSIYSQMYEGHLKLGVPQRSVKVQGSYSDSGSSMTTNSAFWWDADKDDNKKVTMRNTVDTSDNSKRVGLNINLPMINKQLNLNGFTKGGYGTTISDSKAEISYSSDPRKTIIVTAKVSNTEIKSAEDYNYTVVAGFEHAITDINLEFLSHMASVGRVASLGSKFTVRSGDAEKVLSVWGKVDKAQRNMELRVATPVKSVGVQGQLNTVSNQQHLLLRSFEDDKPALRVDARLDQKRQNLDMEINFDRDDPNRMIKVNGHLANDTALQADIVSYNGQQSTLDSLVAVRFNASNILHTRLLWRPALLQDMQTFIGTKLTTFSYAASDTFSKAVDSIGLEVKAKHDLVTGELRSEMRQVFQLMDQEMVSLSSQLEILKVEFRRFYQRNDLHIRDMGEQFKAAFNEILAQVQELVRSYRAYSSGISKATSDWLQGLRAYPITESYRLAIRNLETALKGLRQALEEALDEVAIELEKFSAVSYKHYLDITRTIDRKLNSYSRSILELPIYQQILEQKRQLEELGGTKMPEWAKLYTRAYLQGQQLLQDQFHDMMTRPEFQHIHAITTEIHQQIIQWSLEQTLEAAVKRTLDLTKNLMLMELVKLKNFLINMDKSRVIVYDPERGELQFELHLPFPITSFTQAPDRQVKQYFSYLTKWMKVNLPSANLNAWDTYYGYVPSLEAADYLPPYEASAYLIGGQHFITFDGPHFDFLSGCSHVLTRDIADGNFSVVINYDQKSRRESVKSLCFSIEDFLSFEILSDYRLEVNGRETELPLITDRVKIVREGDFIRVEYAGGLEVLINPRLDLYKATVKGWHHGRVAGLFGQYDNEEGNDKITSNEAQSFEVGRKTCFSKNTAASPDPALDVDKLCSQIFEESTSKFRPCFTQVDPAPFVRLCQIYLAKMTENEAIHLVTEQYRYVCKGEGIFMGPLKDYVPCNNDKSFLVEGSDPLYQSADVLFVVEDSQCNKWAANSLTSLVTETNIALNNAGFKDNRFGMLGYGGINSEDVSLRTINGQYFGEPSRFLKAVETLRLTNSTETADLAKAVKFAIDYPYRPGVAKIMVLAPCSSCEVSFLSRNLGDILADNGFTVHVLQHQGYSFQDSNINKRKYKIYALDQARIIGSNLPDNMQVSDVSGVQGDNYCNSLALGTNGSQFDTVHLKDGGSRIQREFIQAFAHRVGYGAPLPPCQICSCNLELNRVECQLCDSSLSYSYMPWKTPSLVQALGSLHDFNYDVKKYFAYSR